MDTVKIIICAIIGYLLGSISSSILVGKIFGIKDIREHGSGNAGATNTLRTAGKKAAILTVLGDALKGIIAILIARLLTDNPLGTYMAAFFVVLGHNFPVYFGFRGGKGILTSAAVIFMLDWRIGIILLVVSVAVMAITKYVSLGSIVGSLLFPLCVLLLHKYNQEMFILSLIMCILAVARHSGNIKRLLNGTENKLGSKKSEDKNV